MTTDRALTILTCAHSLLATKRIKAGANQGCSVLSISGP
jgi:hypothetical protein